MTHDLERLKGLERAWQNAINAWSRDDGKDAEKTGVLGERLLYAATDLIDEQDTIIAALSPFRQSLTAEPKEKGE